MADKDETTRRPSSSIGGFLRNITPSRMRPSFSRKSESGSSGNSADPSPQRESRSGSFMKRVSGAAVTKQKKRNVITNRTDEDYDDFHKVVVNKSEEHKASILKALQGHFLFQDLAPSSLRDLVDVMKPRTHGPTEDVVTQGALGEEFFVMVNGTAEVLIEGVGKVHQYENVGAFGELALMYSAPRAATIRTVTKCDLYTLDLRTFRFVLAQANESGLMARVNFLRKVKLLQGLGDNQITRIAGALTEETFKDGTYIIKQGDMGDAFYIINHGNVKCTATKDNGSETDLITLKDGDYFGEMALMLDEPRHANCIAVNGEAVCFKLSKVDFLSMFGPLQALLEKQMRLRILKSVPLLAMLSDDELSKVAKAMRVQMFNPGSSIIKEGESGSRFYIINDGVVSVTQNKKGVETELAQLKENDYFGERALIKNEPRKASVSAVTAVELLVLEQKWFQQLLLPSAQGSIEDEMKRREDKRAMSASAKASGASQGAADAAGSNVGGGGGSAAAAASKPQKAKPKFEELKFFGVIGTGTFGRVKLVQQAGTDRVMALKCMAKHQIVSSHQEKNILNEKNILDECSHPFVLEQVATYQSPDELFILMEIIQGGELWSYIYEKTDVIARSPLGGFVEPVAQFYAACVISAFGYIHSLGCAYRDLKPENLLMDATGYIKIIDFGFAKHIPFEKRGKMHQKSFTLCGTPEYLSPELVLSKGHDKSADYWALGCLVYELLCGRTPFAHDNHQEVFKRILQSAKYLRCPSKMNPSVTDLISKLLTPNATMRLGNLEGNTDDIKEHPWFKDVSFEWARLDKRGYKAPYLPKIKDPLDTSNFDDYPEDEPVKSYKGNQEIFKSF